MAHPTCAPARLLIAPPAGESPLQQVAAELGELRETHRAIVRINDLLEQAPLSLREKYRMDAVHASALVDLLQAALDRRYAAAQATLEAMQAARDA